MDCAYRIVVDLMTEDSASHGTVVAEFRLTPRSSQVFAGHDTSLGRCGNPIFLIGKLSAPCDQGISTGKTSTL
jgi:hypothetical protein